MVSSDLCLTKKQKMKTDIEKSIKISIKDESLFEKAFTHRSYLNENKDLRSNERLEFLGDAVLELVVSEYLFETYTNYQEGDLTSFRAAVVRTESLAEEATRLGLGKFLFMSKGEEASGGRERPYILANTFEALLGAIYLDSGMSKVKEFIIKNVCYKLDEVIKNRLDIDPKSKLQELSQEELKETPIYELVEAWGPDHDKKFIMAAMINEIKIAEAEGESKQKAEQNAAQIALDSWNEILKKFKK